MTTIPRDELTAAHLIEFDRIEAVDGGDTSVLVWDKKRLPRFVSAYSQATETRPPLYVELPTLMSDDIEALRSKIREVDPDSEMFIVQPSS